jgi:hypothetical protein
MAITLAKSLVAAADLLYFLGNRHLLPVMVKARRAAI